MFDYQAGEKFKLTLIMVGFAGLMAGMFFTMLLMPTPGPTAHARPKPKWANDPDITGHARLPAPIGAAQAAALQGQQQQPGMPGPGAAAAEPPANYAPVDPATGMNLIHEFLPFAWDMNAASARRSQDQAIMYMTPECATAYKQNVWTEDVAKQVEGAGLQSQFTPSVVKAGGQQPDGSMVVIVEGQQTLRVPQKADRVRAVKLEYLLKMTPDGIRISGISENGSSG